MQARRRTIQGYRTNERIKAQTVRLVGSDGSQLGIVSREDALQQAREIEVDLVEVAPNADPPVCKLLDYGKFKYRQKKKKQGHKQHRPKLKGMRIGFSSEEHDLTFKAEQIKEFLGEHDTVEVFMVLRGRQRAHADLAVGRMTEFATRFEGVAKLERPPQRSSMGRVSMLLAPR